MFDVQLTKAIGLTLSGESNLSNALMPIVIFKTSVITATEEDFPALVQ